MSMQPAARQPGTRPVFWPGPSTTRPVWCPSQPGPIDQAVLGLPDTPAGRHVPARQKKQARSRPGSRCGGITAKGRPSPRARSVTCSSPQSPRDSLRSSARRSLPILHQRRTVATVVAGSPSSTGEISSLALSSLRHWSEAHREFATARPQSVTLIPFPSPHR
jgi:hypothetical protein